MSPRLPRVTVTPALRMEDLFETTAELAHDGRVMESGMPKPLDLAAGEDRPGAWAGGSLRRADAGDRLTPTPSRR